MSTCKKCLQPIAWKQLPNEKWVPTNVDGGDHWDTCKKFQLINSDQELRVGMLTDMTVPDQRSGVVIIDSPIPPWEDAGAAPFPKNPLPYRVIRAGQPYEKWMNPRLWRTS